MEACVHLKDINKFFGKRQVLTNINMSIPYGKIYGILGPSGCGKTTTVKIMAGILPATSGETFVLGKPMPQLDLMNKIGYMAQSDALYAGLTGKENMEFFGSLYGLKNHALKDRISETLRLVNMTDYQDIPVRAYSGGMKRRLSLAMSLLHEPPLLLLDEPTVGIDPVLRHDIWQELYKIARVGTTIVVTTHVMDEAGKCDTLAMMRDGVLLAVGSPAEIIRQSGQNSIEEAFIYFSTGGAGDIHAG